MRSDYGLRRNNYEVAAHFEQMYYQELTQLFG